MPRSKQSVTPVATPTERTQRSQAKLRAEGGAVKVFRLKPQVYDALQTLQQRYAAATEIAVIDQVLLQAQENLPVPDYARSHPSPTHMLLPLAESSVRAGFPSPAENHIEAWLDLNQLLVSHQEATFFVRAKGDSMLQAGIAEGDILVVDRARTASHGHIVIAVIEGEFTVKRLSRVGKQISLVPANPDYPTLTLKPDQELIIWGVVTSCIKQFQV